MFYFYIFFGGLYVLATPFLMWFLRDVWIRTQSAAVATILATQPVNLATHPPWNLSTHPPNYVSKNKTINIPISLVWNPHRARN